ncbi:MAG: GNAT family N-acetyltransferase [Steroidobacteraceae bacterium]
MKLFNDKVRIIRFEPAHHTVLVYKWYHSGDYEQFFGNLPILTLDEIATIQNLYLIVNVDNGDQVYGMYYVSQIRERDRNVHLDLMIDKNYHRLGIGLSSLKIMLYYLLNCMNMYKVKANIFDSNKSCQSLCEKIGYKFHGVQPKDVYLNGEFHDVRLYSIAKTPFNKMFKEEIESSWKEKSQVGDLSA